MKYRKLVVSTGNEHKLDEIRKILKGLPIEVLSKKDELSISGTAKDFSIAMKAVRQIPDVRQEKVNEIIQKMQRGEYSVKASEVAEKILESLKENKI